MQMPFSLSIDQTGPRQNLIDRVEATSQKTVYKTIHAARFLIEVVVVVVVSCLLHNFGALMGLLVLVVVVMNRTSLFFHNGGPVPEIMRAPRNCIVQRAHLRGASGR